MGKREATSSLTQGEAVGCIPADAHQDFLWKSHSFQIKHRMKPIDLQPSGIIGFSLLDRTGLPAGPG